MTRSSPVKLGCQLALIAKNGGSVRPFILLWVVCLLGVAGGALWFYGTTRRGLTEASKEEGQPENALSHATRSVLKRLDSPVQIRFYALLDSASVPASVQALARHVDQLLSEYQREAGDKIQVTRYHSRSDLKAAAVAASADGLKPFNLDKGGA